MSKGLNKTIRGLFKVTRTLISVSVIISGSPFRIIRRFAFAKPTYRASGRLIRKIWR